MNYSKIQKNVHIYINQFMSGEIECKPETEAHFLYVYVFN